jgi:hypothetical protein
MNEEELSEMLEKVGYKLVKVVRFKTYDRIKVELPKHRKLRFLIFNLRRHLEETPKVALLGAILGEDWNKIIGD